MGNCFKEFLEIPVFSSVHFNFSLEILWFLYHTLFDFFSYICSNLSIRSTINLLHFETDQKLSCIFSETRGLLLITYLCSSFYWEMELISVVMERILHKFYAGNCRIIICLVLCLITLVVWHACSTWIWLTIISVGRYLVCGVNFPTLTICK